MHKVIIRHARQVVLVCRHKERILKGEAMKNLAILEGTQHGGVSIVVNEAGIIECIDEDDTINQWYGDCCFEKEIDASGMCVLPGKQMRQNSPPPYTSLCMQVFVNRNRRRNNKIPLGLYAFFVVLW